MGMIMKERGMRHPSRRCRLWEALLLVVVAVVVAASRSRRCSCSWWFLRYCGKRSGQTKRSTTSPMLSLLSRCSVVVVKLWVGMQLAVYGCGVSAVEEEVSVLIQRPTSSQCIAWPPA